MGKMVRHKSFGVGQVTNIEESIIEIDFSGQIKKFQFPKAFESFLSTDDADLLAMIDIAKLKATEKKKTEPLGVSATITDKPHSAGYRSRNNSRSFERNVNSPLVGERAQTIPVYSEEEMFELIGYMASPGRVSSIEAEVPKDGRDETFEKLFPGQKYRPIELGDTPSGMPNKLSPQFRINFASIRNCPEILLKNMGKGNGSCVGRINKSKFVIDIVQNYGFRFGEYQDIDAIRAIAEKKGQLEAFEEGFRR